MLQCKCRAEQVGLISGMVIRYVPSERVTEKGRGWLRAYLRHEVRQRQHRGQQLRCRFALPLHLCRHNRDHLKSALLLFSPYSCYDMKLGDRARFTQLCTSAGSFVCTCIWV